MSYMYTGEYEKAVPYLLKAEQLSLKYGGLYEAMGIVFFHLGDFNKSTDAYRKALSVDPPSARSIELRNTAARIHMHLANALLQKGQTEDAIVQFLSALEIKPEDSIVEEVSRSLRELGELRQESDGRRTS